MSEHIASEHISESDLLLAFDGELPVERDEAVRAHRRACSDCEEKWLRLAELSSEVAHLQCSEVSFRSEEAAVASLAERLDEERPRGTIFARRWANALAVAAVVTACIVCIPTLRVRHQAPANYSFDDSLPAGYVSLPYADPALPLDDASVLPVHLSADDLELMGIDPGGREEVNAEILLGMDGWPRAIKIIDQQ